MKQHPTSRANQVLQIWTTRKVESRTTRTVRGYTDVTEEQLPIALGITCRPTQLPEPQLLPGQQRRARLGTKGTRCEEAALAVEADGVLLGPPPDGDEEELEHLLHLHRSWIWPRPVSMRAVGREGVQSGGGGLRGGGASSQRGPT
jgi:hypothetical protein